MIAKLKREPKVRETILTTLVQQEEPTSKRSVARLIAITPEAEKIMLYCARASSDQENTDVGLIRRSVQRGHWSVFEMAHAVVEFRTSRAMSHELIRHKSFAFQEFSQRYASPKEYFFYTGRRQAEKNRQSSIDDMPEFDQKWWVRSQQMVRDFCLGIYDEAIERGFARETSRFVLPEATGTLIYMAGTIRSWIHYIELRKEEDAQQEHQELAIAARDVLAPELPTIADALDWT